MKLQRVHWAGILLAAVAALASLAPTAADARSRYFRSGSDGPYVGAPYRIYPDENRWGRSYYYEDPYCGIRDQYLSRLTPHYDRGHPPLVYMIDNRTGWVINTYAWERGRWCKVSSGLVSIRDYERGPEPYAWGRGRGWND